MKNLIVFIKKHKIAVIVIGVIWLLVEILFVSPIAYTLGDSYVNGVFNLELFFQGFFVNMTNLSCFLKVFNALYIGHFIKVTFIFSIIYSIAIGVGIYKGRKKGTYDKIEHGSSDWSEGGEQYRVLNKHEGIILAENNYLPLDKIGNINVLIVGGSGTGKSSSYTIPNAHQLLGSYIFTDPKGEIYDATAGYLSLQGYEIKLLNLVNPKSSDSYNPLHHITSEIDVDVIANTIVRGQKTGETKASDPYWDNMSELLLKALIYYLLATRPPEEQNLASCAELVRAANNNGEANLLSDLINKLPYDHPSRMNFKSVELASDKTYSSILSSLQSALGKFDSKDIADVTSTNTINFEEIATRKTALYVVSSDTHAAYDFLLTIFFSQMIQQLYDFADRNGGKLPIPTFFVLDEFANIGQIPDFDKKISTSRSRGISFSVILQNLDQLKAIYEKSYETIIGNCDTHVFLGSNSYATVEYFSKELGEKTITHNSKSINRDKSAGKTGYSESKQIMARALMTPDELRRMPNDECIIFEKGLKPVKAKKYFWYKKNEIVKDLTTTQISHNAYEVDERGEWRKFNPYNPYTGKEREDEQKLEVGSLDDLFEDSFEDTEDTLINNNTTEKIKTNESPSEDQKQIQSMVIEQSVNKAIQNSINQSASTNQLKETINKINENKQDNLVNNPNNPNNSNNLNNLKIEQEKQYVSNYDEKYNNKFENQEDDIDIQKELEAKFDELFGKLDE